MLRRACAASPARTPSHKTSITPRAVAARAYTTHSPARSTPKSLIVARPAGLAARAPDASFLSVSPPARASVAPRPFARHSSGGSSSSHGAQDNTRQVLGASLDLAGLLALSTALGAVVFVLFSDDTLEVWAEGEKKRSEKGTTAAGTTSADINSKAPTVAEEPVPVYERTGRKTRVVVLGAGWAAVGLLKTLDPTLYDVVVVSPRNYFLFTPMLPGTTTGTVDTRSVIEPIRRIIHDITGWQFVELEATAVDTAAQTVLAEDKTDFTGPVKRVRISYDKLVVAVGSVNNTFGTPGVKENCFFLKEIPDTVRIRERILDVLETANIPGTPDEERKKMLSFVVVGGGPTGVEFAAELHDFMATDVKRLYPELAPHLSLHIVQSGDHILNNYDVAISKYTEEHFKRAHIDVITNARVTKIEPNAAFMIDKSTNKEVKLPFGFCLWATGVGPSPFVQNLCKAIPGQYNTKAILTNSHLEVEGVKNVYALGDCATIEQRKVLGRLEELFVHADKDKDGRLSLEEFKGIYDEEQSRYPQLAVFGPRLDKLFKEFDKDGKGQITRDGLKEILQRADAGLKALPATAQVANQQGVWLGAHLNDLGKGESRDKLAHFSYKHAGSFSYIGDYAAVGEVQQGGWQSKLTGFGAWWAYRGVYFSKQVSFRNRAAIAADWIKCFMFGRDISRF